MQFKETMTRSRMDEKVKDQELGRTYIIAVADLDQKF